MRSKIRKSLLILLGAMFVLPVVYALGPVPGTDNTMDVTFSGGGPLINFRAPASFGNITVGGDATFNGTVTGISGITGLTATRVPFAASATTLSDDADMTFVTDTLTVAKIIGSTSITDSGLTAARVPFAGTGGLLSDDADMQFATNNFWATINCSVGLLEAANSVCLNSNGIISEGSGADANELTLAFGNHTQDFTVTETASLDASSTPKLVRQYTTSGTNFFDVYRAAASGNFAGIGAENDLGTAQLTVIAYGSAFSGASNFVALTARGTALAGMSVGTETADPLNFITNSVEQMALRPSAVGPDLVLQALTAATMTAENVAQVRNVVSSYTWSNAQVAALSGTAGDITVATLPAKTRVKNAYVVITGAAAGPATVTVSCGDANDGTPFIGYVVPSDAKAAANTVYGDAVGERGASIDVEFYYLPAYAATTLVSCHFISTAANLSTVTGSTGRVILETSLVP